MHEMEQPIDKILSIVGPEWHGLATVKEIITKAIMQEEGLFPILRKSEVINYNGPVPAEGDEDVSLRAALSAFHERITQNGITKATLAAEFEEFAKGFTFVDTHKTVVADYTLARPDLAPNLIIPMGIPKNSYGLITNEMAFDSVVRAFGESAKVVTAGTLRAGKVFFTSLEVDQSVYTGPRGDQFSQYVDVFTSHDGTMATNIYDSSVRIVCMNTLRASMNNKGDFSRVVYHTKNAESELAKASADLGALLAARKAYFESLEYLDSVQCSRERARYLSAAFLHFWNVGEDEKPRLLSSQAFNKADEIADSAKTSPGTRGETLYDLLNGFTYTYTWGSGTGKEEKKSKAEKFLTSRDGTAAELKEDFLKFLCESGDFLDERAAAGEKLYKEKELARAK